MNILHIIPGDLWAGKEAQVYYTVKELNKISQNKISVILFSKGELYKRLLDVDIDVMLLDEECLSHIAICYRIKQKLIDSDVHIVHVHEYKSHLLTSLSRLMAGRKKNVLFRTSHGQNVPSGLKSFLVLGCQQLFLRYMTGHLIAVSDQLKKELLQVSTRADIHMIYNAVDLSMLPSPSDVSEVRRLYGLKEKQLWIGTAARLEVVKNLQMLIEAAGHLRNKHPELSFRISIFGEGSLREVLASQILEHGLADMVFLEGHTNHIMAVLQGLDIFTLTSENEGLPMSLLEAMSVGTIPVCTAVGGMKEVVSHGENGFLVSSGDSEALADMFANIHSETLNLKLIRAKAQEKINRVFSIEQNCEKLLALYQAALLKIK